MSLPGTHSITDPVAMSLLQIAPGATDSDLQDFTERHAGKTGNSSIEERTTVEAQLALLHRRAETLPDANLLEHIEIHVTDSDSPMGADHGECMMPIICGIDIKFKIMIRKVMFHVSQALAMGLFLHEYGHVKSLLQSQDPKNYSVNIRDQVKFADAYASKHGTAAELSALCDYFDACRRAHTETWTSGKTYLYSKVASKSLNQSQKDMVLTAIDNQLSHIRKCFDAQRTHPPYEDRIRMINEIANKRGLVLTHRTIDLDQLKKLAGRLTPLSAEELKISLESLIVPPFKEAVERALSSNDTTIPRVWEVKKLL